MRKIGPANTCDEDEVKHGRLTADHIRTVDVEAVVSSHATMLVFPEKLVSRLGLRHQAHRKARYVDGRVAELPWVAGIRITILGRDAIVNALAGVAGTTPVVGHIPLTALDLHLDPASGDLGVDPDSPDEPLFDALSAA